MPEFKKLWVSQWLWLWDKVLEEVMVFPLSRLLWVYVIVYVTFIPHPIIIVDKVLKVVMVFPIIMRPMFSRDNWLLWNEYLITWIICSLNINVLRG